MRTAAHTQTLPHIHTNWLAMLRYSQVDTHDPHTLRSAWLRAKLIVTARKLILTASPQHLCVKLLTTAVGVWHSITHNKVDED